MVVPAHARDCCLLFARAAGGLGLGGPAFSLYTALKHSKGSREALLYAAEPEVPAHRGTCHRPDMSHDTRQGGQGGRTENTISIIETGDAGPQDSGVGGPMCSRGAGAHAREGSGGDYSTVKYINCVHKS